MRLPCGWLASSGATCRTAAWKSRAPPDALSERRFNRVSSSAVTSAPIRLPWFSSTDWMVSSSPEFTAERNR